MAKKEKVLITGGAGFIGSHTADALSKKGFQIKILDALVPPTHQKKEWPKYVKNKRFELIKGDILDISALKKALSGVSYIYHFAAYQDQRLNFSKYFNVNTRGSALIYELIVAKKLPVKKVILASSQFSYGDGLYKCSHSSNVFMPELRSLNQFLAGDWEIKCPHGKPAHFLPFKESQKLNPTNAYGLSKQTMEDLAFRFGKTHKIPTVALRYSVVQGPRQTPLNFYSGVIRIFTSQAITGVPITVYEDGQQIRDFVNINDVVKANLTVLASHKANFEAFNVGGDKGYKVIDFAKAVKRIANSSSEITVGSFRRTDSRHEISDVSKLKRLGWRPQFTPKDSIKSYVEWFQKEGFGGKVKRSALLSLRKGIRN